MMLLMLFVLPGRLSRVRHLCSMLVFADTLLVQLEASLNRDCMVLSCLVTHLQVVCVFQRLDKHVPVHLLFYDTAT